MIKQIPVTNDEIYELSAFAFQSPATPEQMEQKKKEKENETVWGWMEGENLAAKVHIIPLETRIHGKVMKTGGISSVATWPEYRRKGAVRKLLLHAIGEMKKEGQIISYLAPFSVPFYRKFGWEMTINEMQFTIPMDRVPRFKDTSGYVRRLKKGEESILKDVYQEYTKQYTGMLVRDDHWWEHKIFSKEQLTTVISYDDEGNADGYIRYKVRDNKMDIDEWVAVTPNSKKRLLQFIANHDSMAKEVHITLPDDDLLPLFLEEPRAKQEQEPYFMTRIVDVEAFLKMYPFLTRGNREGVYTIQVKDEVFEDNSGFYHIHFQNGSHQIEKMEAPSNRIHTTASMTIQQLAMVLLGTQTMEQLYQLDFVSGDMDKIVKLDQYIPKKRHPYLADFF
ncbi:enhanced intracellular survival protein Eis [Oceanobacillus sp. J11TS1]|uniref:GNAT family N-acetyltransferase n=1 Tax=Oceanobacillus sp. J11TS1 TaxID=2807191 RepID=UPI001B09EA76|nr:GNAT family N-acetyltransferase [Oceanobacillus sp. J11TS1]GIO23079.1 acetyltransferase [Oceanobacillus sp. J11TS1]